MKFNTSVLITAAFTLLFGFGAHAQANNTKQNASGNPQIQTNRPGFVDANNDGVCDHAVKGRNEARGTGFTDKNNDGICDNRSAVSGKGNSYRHQGQCSNRGNDKGGNYGRGNRR